MHTRSAELTAYLHSLHDAITARAAPHSSELHVTHKIMRALAVPSRSASPTPCQLPVCALLANAVENVTAATARETSQAVNPLSPTVAEHANALQALSPKLAWWQRTEQIEPGSPMATGHANATVIGPGGLEQCDDVLVGISLIAPGIEYPQHHHPPEEVYLVLSQGHWQKNAGAWFEPGIGGLVHNPAGILHAMRSGPTPLLASWCLWRGD